MNVKWQYSETSQHEGNDCLITKVVNIMEVDDSYYICTCATIYKGWMGTTSDTKSCVFSTSYEDARKYCDEYMN